MAAFAEFAKAGAQKFLAAAEDPADGVSLIFTIAQPPGLKAIAQAIAQKGGAPADVAEAIAQGRGAGGSRRGVRRGET